MSNTMDILLRAKGGDATKGEIKKVNKEVSESTKIFKTLGTMLSVGILAKGIKDSIAAYKIQEIAVTKLNSALKAQGVFTEGLSKRLQKQASALQSVTLFGDEAILSAQAFGMSMGLSADTVEKIIPLILDFASAMGIKAEAAFKIVGQAAAGNVGTLKSYGIVVDEAALKSDGFNAVLDVMQKQFKGTAREVAKSGIGPMEQFKNTMGDMMEIVGETLIPALNTLLGTLVKIGKAITGNNDAANEQAKASKMVTEFLRDENVEQWKKQRVMLLISDASRGMAEEFVKTQMAETNAAKIRVEQSDAWRKKLEDEAKKEEKARDERIKKVKETEEKEYDLRRELRELNLKQVLADIEKQIEAEEVGSERRKALELAFTEYKQALRLDDAARIAEVQDSIASNLEGNLATMLLAEKTFAEGAGDVWDGLKRIVIEAIARTVVEERVAAAARIAAEQAVAAAKAISAYAGIPVVGLALGIAAVASIAGEISKNKFHGGGVVPGAPGEERLVMAKAGERFTPSGVAGTGNGGQIIQLIVNINGTLIEGDETKWDRIVRTKLMPPIQRFLKKTGEQFSGG